MYANICIEYITYIRMHTLHISIIKRVLFSTEFRWIFYHQNLYCYTYEKKPSCHQTTRMLELLSTLWSDVLRAIFTFSTAMSEQSSMRLTCTIPVAFLPLVERYWSKRKLVKKLSKYTTLLSDGKTLHNFTTTDPSSPSCGVLGQHPDKDRVARSIRERCYWPNLITKVDWLPTDVLLCAVSAIIWHHWVIDWQILLTWKMGDELRVERCE